MAGVEGAVANGGAQSKKLAAVEDVEAGLEAPASATATEAKEAAPVPYFTLFRYADRKDAGLMVAGFLGAAVTGASMPIFSIIFGNLLNSLGGNQFDVDALKHAVNRNCAYFVYLGLGTLVAGFLQLACWIATSVRQTNRIRLKYLAAVLRQDVSFFDTETTSGRLLQGLNEDCLTVQQGIGEKLGMVIFNLSTAVVGIIIAFVRGWDLTLVMLACTPLLALMGFLIAIAMTKMSAKINKAYADANSVAQQALGNIRTVYAFNGDTKTVQAYDQCLDEPTRVGIRQGFLGGVTLGVTNCVAFFTYALALWYGARRVAAGAYTGGDVLNVLFAALFGGFALGQAAPNLQYFAQASGAGGRIFDVLHREPTIDVDGPGESLEKVEGQVEFRGVDFCYPSRPDVQVFRGFSLTVPAGATVALVGESGSGKSTVVSLIERFYDPLAGGVFLDGTDLRDLSLRWLRSRIGLVSQEPSLFATTIADNIRYGKPGASMEEVIEAAKSANAHTFISSLPKGYDTQVGEKGTQMSGGQKQRIAIARAIIKDPRVLLLDEATSALDAQSEKVVQDALDALMKGRTTVVVAHRLSTVMAADSIAVVKKGRIVEQGTHDELMAAGGAYKLLVEMQQMEGAQQEEEEDDDVGYLPSLNVDTASVDGSSKGDPSSPGRRASADGRRVSLGDTPEKLPALVEDLAEGVGKVGALGNGVRGGGRAVVPGVALQRNVSGWRRFVSYRRKTPAERAAPPKREPAPEADADETKKQVPMSRIYSLSKPELPALLAGLVGSGLLGMMMPAFAIAFSSLITAFYLPPDQVVQGARKWSLVFVGIGGGTVVASLLQSYNFNYMGQKLARRVRGLLMRALLRQEVGWYDRPGNSSGVLASKLNSDAMAVKGQFGDTMGLLTQNLVTLIASLIIGFINSWQVSLVVVAAMPIIGGAAYMQTKMMLGAGEKEDETFAQANQSASEAFTNIRTIAAFSMEGKVVELFDAELQKPAKESRKRALAAGAGFGVSQFVLFAVYALAFWFGALLISRGQASFEGVLKAFFAIFLAAFGAAQAQLFFPDVAKGKAASQRVFNVIDRAPLIDASSEEGERPPVCTGAIELRGVTFAYPQRPEVRVMRNFNLTVAPSSKVALVGESGSGKSTIIALIERFYDPLAGGVFLDGVDLRDLNLRWLRSHVGLVSQEPVLFNMTVAENIRYGRELATFEEVVAAARAANAASFIEALPEGYDTRLGEGGIQLSGGQKQRVAIARAVVKDPRVLLLDEATSALDAESEHVVQEALEALMRGRTTVVVAHRLSTVRDADAIAVISSGKIIEMGTHDELAARPRGAYAGLVRHQMTRTRGTTAA